MVSRAIYLQKAIEMFIEDDDNDMKRFKLTKKEWAQAHLVATILLPFKKISTKLQKTSIPSIDSVFWAYESLFNKIDAIKSTFNAPMYKDETWAIEVHMAIDQLVEKLKKHYTLTKHCFVYPDAVLLEPRGKLILLKQETFPVGYAEKCKNDCHKRFMEHYQSLPSVDVVNSPISRKRKRYDVDSDDSDDDGYRQLLHEHAAKDIDNEFDRYLATPAPSNSCSALQWWKMNQTVFPALAQMARDIFAVPATGASVEREFSKSGRVASWTHASLNPSAITETMVYKSYLTRTAPLASSSKHRKILAVDRGQDNSDDSDTEAETEERATLIIWEKMWWQKVEAQIQT